MTVISTAYKVFMMRINCCLVRNSAAKRGGSVDRDSKRGLCQAGPVRGGGGAQRLYPQSPDIPAFPRYINGAPGTSGLLALGEGMTGTTRSSAGLDERRRRLLFRSWHRGTREMDLILGRFADAVIGELSEAEVDALEALSEFPDPDLYAWLSGARPVPAEHDIAMFRRLRDFHLTGTP
jgi:antitoxin CptB